MARYPGAHWLPSRVHHPMRSETRGIVIHWTAGHKPGDIAVLRGPNVDVHFYVDKAGEVYQFLSSDSMAWHAFATANDTCIGIEHEGSGEPWTKAQLKASAKLSAWLCRRYRIPVEHVHPRIGHWHGLFGHLDLMGIDGNNHTDTVPNGTGWARYLTAIKHHGLVQRKLFPLWELVERGHVIWQRRMKKAPGWVTEITREELDARLVKHK